MHFRFSSSFTVSFYSVSSYISSLSGGGITIFTVGSTSVSSGIKSVYFEATVMPSGSSSVISSFSSSGVLLNVYSLVIWHSAP